MTVQSINEASLSMKWSNDDKKIHESRSQLVECNIMNHN